MSWTLHCTTGCGYSAPGDKLASLCPSCAQPLTVRYDHAPARESVSTDWSLWRYAAALPIAAGETRVSLGEGMTALLELPALAREVGVRRLWVKDEGQNPTGSFKARGAFNTLIAGPVPKAGVVAASGGNHGVTP